MRKRYCNMLFIFYYLFYFYSVYSIFVCFCCFMGAKIYNLLEWERVSGGDCVFGQLYLVYLIFLCHLLFTPLLLNHDNNEIPFSFCQSFKSLPNLVDWNQKWSQVSAIPISTSSLLNWILFLIFA